MGTTVITDVRPTPSRTARRRMDAGVRTWIDGHPGLDAPLLTAGILVAAATVFVLVRLAFAAHGDLSRFVQAGTQFVDPARVPHGLAVRPGAGYDGQFYYRLALQPWNLSWRAHGITFDFGLRRQRVGYSWVAWILSGGQAVVVPYALVAANVLGLGALGFFTGKWAQSLGRHALWGLLPAGYFGLVWTLSRDLTEITAITLVVAGIVAWRSQHVIWSGLAFSGAVLSRETAVMVVAALAVTRVVGIARRKEQWGRADLAWALPAAVFVGWQAVSAVVYGSLPLSSEGENASVPLSGAIRTVSGWIEHPDLTHLLQLIQLAVLAAVIVLAAWNLRRSLSSPFERLAFVFSVLLLAVLSTSIWNNDPREFRTMVDVFVLGSGVLLGTRTFRPLLLTGATWGVWLLVAGLSLKYI
jgi:hypothetical protein